MLLAISGNRFFAFRLGGAAIVVFPRNVTTVLYMVYCKGFRSTGWIFPYTSLLICRNIYMTIYWLITVL